MHNQSRVVYNNLVKKALIFDPYLDTLGGGEYFSFEVGNFLIKKGFIVEIAWYNENILKEAERRFGLNFTYSFKINSQASSLFKTKGNLINKYNFTKNYDLIFYVSDGSIPLLFSKKNILLFQAPFVRVSGRTLLNQLKLKTVNKVICYSNFVKKFIDKEFGINSTVLYPPINNIFFKLTPISKENIILSVGRFDQIMNAKKQDVLVKVFRQMVDMGLKDWQLVLLGGLMKGNDYFRKLQKISQGYPIKIITNVNFKTLIHYYQKAKIYWHAAGFNENLNVNPDRAEHFGISIVEAMAAGAVPVVFNGGGIKEIIQNEGNGFLWQTPTDLVNQTKKIINNPGLFRDFSHKALQRAGMFNQTLFYNRLAAIIK